ncbi:hypothetical protein ACLKA7_016023 [Drosophila subpalustris]
MCLLSQHVLKILNALFLAILLQFCCIEIYVDIDDVMYQSRDTALLISSCTITTLFMISIFCLGFFVLFKGYLLQLRLLAVGIFLFILIKCTIFMTFLALRNNKNVASYNSPWLQLTICWAIICLISVFQLLFRTSLDQEIRQ